MKYLIIIMIAIFLLQCFIFGGIMAIDKGMNADYSRLRRTISEIKSEKTQQEQIIENQAEMIKSMADNCKL